MADGEARAVVGDLEDSRLPVAAPRHVTWLAPAWRSTLASASWAIRNISRSCRRGRRPDSWLRSDDVERAALAHTFQVQVEHREHVLRVGHVGSQVVEGVSHLADDAADVGTELLERGAYVVALGRRSSRCGRARRPDTRATARCGRAGHGRCGSAPPRRPPCGAERTSGRCRWPARLARRTRSAARRRGR